MTRSRHAVPLALIAILAFAACSSSSGPTQGPGATSPAATTSGGEPTNPAVAGQPCSYLTAEEVGAVVGIVPVEVAERVGRGDCDYWLTSAQDEKVNIGVTTGPDAQSLFDVTKGMGDPQPVSLGDEAYSIYNESIGTLVVVMKGDSVVAVQVATSADTAEQLAHATALADAIVATL